MPPTEPDTSTLPVMLTAPVARKSRMALEPGVTVTLTPTGMVMVVKLWMPGVSTVLTVGLNGPSRPVEVNEHVKPLPA